LRPKYDSQFPIWRYSPVDEVFGGWQKAQKKHFERAGTFDQIYQPGSEMRATVPRYSILGPGFSGLLRMLYLAWWC